MKNCEWGIVLSLRYSEGPITAGSEPPFSWEMIPEDQPPGISQGEKIKQGIQPSLMPHWPAAQYTPSEKADPEACRHLLLY